MPLTGIVVTANNNIADAKISNRNMCLFSDKKKSPLNEDKCFILPNPISIFEVNSKAMSTTQTAKYTSGISSTRKETIRILLVIECVEEHRAV